MTQTKPKLPDAKIKFYPATGQRFGYLAWCRVLGYRCPLAGEYYLSGAVVQAWEAPDDLEQAYWIVEPIFPPDCIHLHEYQGGHAHG